jgi:Ice-binding-like/Putative Ig domain
MKRTHFRLLGAFVGFAAFLSVCAPALLAAVVPAPPMGTAWPFAVLAGTTVTNTGASTHIIGDVGIHPGAAYPGLLASQVVGTIHAADAVALQAKDDLKTAYLAVDGTPCGVDLTGQDLAGMILPPNVYCFTGGAGLSAASPLTLDFQNDPNAVFLFKAASTLITEVDSRVVLINNLGTICPPNVYWEVGSSATLKVRSNFVGNILALTSIALQTDAILNGRALARNAAVTLDSNKVTACPLVAILPPGCPVITVNPATLPNGTLGIAYSQTVSGSGGLAPYTFSVTAGALPNGLLLNGATGAITGTPTTVGNFNFTITATDANGCPGTRTYTIVIAAAVCPAITVNPATLPNPVIGIVYSQQITASGGVGPYTYAVTSGALPNGLVLNGATGAITGTPTTAAAFNFTITATDSSGCQGIRAYAVTAACPVITLTPATLPPITVGTAYSQTITVVGGGPGPYDFVPTAGALPAGLALTGATNTSVNITGMPTTAGPFSLEITATDRLNPSCFAKITYTASAYSPVGGPTLDPLGLMVLVLLLAAAGVLLVNRFTM